MAVLSVVQGLVETEDGKVFEFDSPKGSAWLETVTSFRFEPTGANKPYTVRKELRPYGDYWYGYRKVAGRLHKKYIGKTPELNTGKLEEIAEVLNTPPQPRVKVTHAVNTPATHEITNSREADRLTALEQQMQTLQSSFQALREELLGKSDSGDSMELPKVNSEVTERLQNELSNLRVDNEWLRQKLAETQSTVESLSWEREALNEQLEVLQTENQRLLTDLGNFQAEREEIAQLKKDAAKAAAEVYREGRSVKIEKDRWQAELSEARADLAAAKATIVQKQGKILELERGYSFQPNPEERRLRLEIGELQSQLSNLQQKTAATSETPDAANLLNQLKAKRKKSKTDLADLEVILEILEG